MADCAIPSDEQALDRITDGLADYLSQLITEPDLATHHAELIIYWLADQGWRPTLTCDDEIRFWDVDPARVLLDEFSARMHELAAGAAR